MQFVAASKMKKAQEAAISGKDYALGLIDMTKLLSSHMNESTHPLIGKKEDARKVNLIVLVAPQKGLCGGLITNLTRFVTQEIDSTKNKIEIVAIGSKAKLIANRLGLEIFADFELEFSHPTFEMVPPIARAIEDKFTRGEVESVQVIYADFINTMLQKPRKAKLLPLVIDFDEEKSTDVVLENTNKEYLFEPDVKSIVEPMLGMYLETEIYQILLESYASEQSARMVAMKNATDNATSLISDLTVEYNKVRQASITNEILDIGNARAITAA